MRRVITIGAALASSVLLPALGAGCGGNDGGPNESSKPPPVPHTLADGTKPAAMPDGLRRFGGLPVIEAKELPGQAGELLCPADRSLEGRTQPAGAWISTEGLSVGYGVPDSSQLYSCDAVSVDGHWKTCATTLLTVHSSEELTKAKSATTCSDPEPTRGFVWIAVPSGAAWALVDHRSFWTAYLAFNRPVLRISGTEGVDPGDSVEARIAFVDERGRKVTETEIKGAVAD